MKADNTVLINEEGELERESNLHIAKLLKAKTVQEAQAEVIFHFAREYEIKEKYKKHREVLGGLSMGYQESLLKVSKYSFDNVVEYLDKHKDELDVLIDITSVITFKKDLKVNDIEFTKGENCICITGDRSGHNLGFIFEKSKNYSGKSKLIPIEALGEENLNKMFKGNELIKEVNFKNYAKSNEATLSR
jgi:hypothetical protein